MDKIVIEKSGVVDYAENTLFINSEDIVCEVMNRVKKARPKQNYMGAFAARVCLSIELLGDTEGRKNETNNEN